MSYGILAHTVGKWPLQQLTEKLSIYGLDFVQLALSKAISDIDTDLGKLSPGLANHIAEQFDRQGIRIGVLGCYINPIHPDPLQRRFDIDRFKEHIRFARDFGASIVATETGNLTTYLVQEPMRFKEMGWELLKQAVEELAEEAEKWGIYVGLEPVSDHTLSSAERMQHLLKEIPSSQIGVVFDPCNLLKDIIPENQDKVIAEAFKAFGNRIVLAHLKDLKRDENNILQETKPGAGIFNISGFLNALNRHKPYVDISLEGISEGEIAEALQYVKELSRT